MADLCVIYIDQDEITVLFVSILKQDDTDDNDDSPCTLSQFGTLRKVKTTMIAREQR